MQRPQIPTESVVCGHPKLGEKRIVKHFGQYGFEDAVREQGAWHCEKANAFDIVCANGEKLRKINSKTLKSLMR